ncbi:MAG: hypothetical protein CMM58_11845 [Rhodospirillaceae bacterium]|nr:hypothetical protein [Rhodospirillaceae bacterium]|tara:strand:+ start:2808 stop:3491 length:684 start_codon:yes stop_codon:yes gene_type:complete
MALYGKGMLMTFTETSAENEEEFNEWYNREHVDERVWMPGFHRARRYLASQGSAEFKYFATYETDTVKDLANPEYMELLKDQSDWSKKVMATFTKFDRITADISIDLAHGFGGGCSIARFFPKIETMQALRKHLEQDLLPKLTTQPGVVGCVLAENNLEVVNEGRRAQGIDIPMNETPEWIIVLEAQDSNISSRAVASLCEPGFPEFSIKSTDIERASYNLLFGNNR